MYAKRHIMGLALALLVAAGVRADMVALTQGPSESPPANALDQQPATTTAPLSALFPSNALSALGLPGATGLGAAAMTGFEFPTQETPQAVIDLPAPPGSAALGLWALGPMGMWQLGRSARKVHLGALPEWYHANGPAQIGHKLVFDLDFSDAALPVCAFAGPAGPRPTVYRPRRNPYPRCGAQAILNVVGPRGPPVDAI